MPATWGATLGEMFRGRVSYRRKFGKPTGLQPSDRVELVCDGVDAFGTAELNETLLGDIPPGLRLTRFDITKLLQPRNQLIIEVSLPMLDSRASGMHASEREHRTGGIVGEVRLEIFAGTE